MSNNFINVKGSKILIVDDKQENLQLLAKMLEDEGYEIAFATSGEEAIKIATLYLPDIVLLDVMMPGIDGFETCQRFKSFYDLREIPVIFVTGKADVCDIADGFAAGGVDYVTKPIRREEIIARIETHLKLQALIRIRDELITSLREQNIELEKMSRIKDEKLKLSEQFNYIGELVGELTHEVATPLGIMKTAVTALIHQNTSIDNLVKGQQLSKKSLNDYLTASGQGLDISLVNLQHTIELVDNFKNIVVGEFSNNKIEFMICVYLEDIKQIIGPKITNSGHKLIVECDQNITLYGETGILSQILINIIDNALNHAFIGQVHGEITITVAEQESTVTLTIADNGKGLESAQHEKIFEKYYTTRQKEGGSGLGLHIVKKLVANNLKGEISVESHLGKGTRFILTLPKH